MPHDKLHVRSGWSKAMWGWHVTNFKNGRTYSAWIVAWSRKRCTGHALAGDPKKVASSVQDHQKLHIGSSDFNVGVVQPGFTKVTPLMPLTPSWQLRYYNEIPFAGRHKYFHVCNVLLPINMKMLLALGCQTPYRRTSIDDSQVCYDSVQSNSDLESLMNCTPRVAAICSYPQMVKRR